MWNEVEKFLDKEKYDAKIYFINYINLKSIPSKLEYDEFLNMYSISKPLGNIKYMVKNLFYKRMPKLS